MLSPALAAVLLSQPVPRELFANKDFTSDISGVVQDTGAVVWDSGALSVSDVGGADGQARIAIPTISGRWYIINGVIRSSTTQVLLVGGDNSGGGLANNFQVTIAGTTAVPLAFSRIFRSTFNNGAVGIVSATTNQTVLIESLSVRPYS